MPEEEEVMMADTVPPVPVGPAVVELGKPKGVEGVGELELFG